MTNRLYLRCEVCEAVTIVRVQVGWLDWHPMIIPCGRCGILISGTAKFDQRHGKTDYEFNNAVEIVEVRPDYYLEVSGEIPTDLLKTWEGGTFVWSPPPFFQVLQSMGQERYEEFKAKTLGFLYSLKNQWPTVRRINELWNSRRTEFLPAEVHRHLDRKQFPMSNNAEMLRGVHQINLIFFMPLLETNYFEHATETLMPALRSAADKSSVGFLELHDDFGQKGLLLHYEESLFDRLENFVEIFRLIIPAFAVQFYRHPPADNKGVTTARFDDLKHYYADTYETLGEVLTIVVALDNLLIRGNYKAMRSVRGDTVTLDDFLARTKGERLQFLDGEEPFGEILFSHLDNRLRNAIAHNSYTYDQIRQDITYFPSGKLGRGEELHVSLLGFAQKCWNLHQRVMAVSELVYQVDKNYFVLIRGDRIVDSSVFDQPKEPQSRRDVVAERLKSVRFRKRRK